MQGIIPGNLRAFISKNSGNFLVIASHHGTVSVVLLATQPNMSVRSIEGNVVANLFMSNIVLFQLLCSFFLSFLKVNAEFRCFELKQFEDVTLRKLWPNKYLINVEDNQQIDGWWQRLFDAARAADVALTTRSCFCSSDVWQQNFIFILFFFIVHWELTLWKRFSLINRLPRASTCRVLCCFSKCGFMCVCTQRCNMWEPTTCRIHPGVTANG